MEKLKIPSIYQINESEVLQKIGKYAVITDFAIMTGKMSKKNLKNFNYFNYGICSSYWTSSSYDTDYRKKFIINESGKEDSSLYNNKEVGVRLIMPYDEISLDSFDIMIDNNGIKYIRYGYYPQNIVSGNLKNEDRKMDTKQLFDMLNKGKLKLESDLTYHPNMNYVGNHNNIKIYKRECCKYALIEGIKNPNISLPLNYDNKFYNFKRYLVEINPVEWYIDKKLKILISKKILLSGLSYDNELINDNFLNNYVYKEIFKYEDKKLNIPKIPNEEITIEEEKTKEYTSINNRMNDIKKRIRKLQER